MALELSDRIISILFITISISFRNQRRFPAGSAAFRVSLTSIIIHQVLGQVSYTDVFPYRWTSPPGFNLSCPTDWTLRGPTCLRTLTESLSWQEAKITCRNMGGQLAQVHELNTNLYIGNMFRDSPANTTIDWYWLGMTRAGSIGYDDSFWSDGSKTTTLIGRWVAGQPNDASGYCVMSQNDAALQYPWSMQWCEQRLPFACQLEACLTTEVRCASGQCISSDKYCDGQNDCGDWSEEVNCAGKCRYHLTESTTTLNMSSYKANARCFWLLEGPVGTQITLKFTTFNTEEFADFIQIYTGGATIPTSDYVTTVSGAISPPPTYESQNNYLIVIFSSDSDIEKAGFTATWSANPVPEVTLLTSDTPKTLGSPYYPEKYPLNTRRVWYLQTDRWWDVISLQVIDIDLADGDTLTIYNGRERTDPVLQEYTSQGNGQPFSLISSKNMIHVRLQTTAKTPGTGFSLIYHSGCMADLSDAFGVIQSPGYGQTTYPSLQTCTWNIARTNSSPFTLIFDQIDLAPGDQLQLYNGTHTTAIESLGPIHVSGGSLMVTLKSDAINSAMGFQAEYSADCPQLSFNETKMEIDGKNSNWFRSNFTVRCKTGYFFVQQEYGHCEGGAIDQSNGVTMICGLDGKWNHPRTPVCKEIYCGAPEGVHNGKLVNVSSGSFQGLALYACYSGFNMVGSNTSECQADGTWSAKPECQAKDCGTPINITGGSYSYIEGKNDSTVYGTVIRYECNVGYYRGGGVFVAFCPDHGNWSNAEPLQRPVCRVKMCSVPAIINGNTSVPVDSLVDYDSTIEVKCNPGYKLPNNTQSAVMCGQDGQFARVPHCVDIDECSNPTSCNINATCSNTPGSFMCECKEGYRLTMDKRSCTDYLECQNANGDCQEICIEKSPGYICECPQNWTIYDMEGKNGYVIPDGENGLESWNSIHLNHSCIPQICPRLSYPIENGDLSVFQPNTTYYYIGVSVTVFCEIGYQFNNSTETRRTLTCMENGLWDQPLPQCVAVYCGAVNTEGLKNPPPLSNNGPVMFGEEVEMNCTYPDNSFIINRQKCIYDASDGKYKLQGNSVECGIVECAPPGDIPGVDNATLPTTLRPVDDIFMFTCKDGFTLRGSSQINNNTQVLCQKNGYWDLGSLQCSGPACTDPGRPPDGRQVSSSFEEGQVVRFECDKPGYTPIPSEITCLVTRNLSIWSEEENPTCEDKALPVISNCPASPLVLYRYESVLEGLLRLNMPLPSASDNSGSTKSFSSDTNIHKPIEDSTHLAWTALDFTGNHRTCSVNITIKDHTYPSIDNCSVSQYEYLINEADDDLVTLSSPNEFSVIQPAEYRVNKDSLYKQQNFVVVATNDEGFNTTCSFQRFVIPGSCQPWALPAPDNGQKTCIQIADGSWSCDLACDPGYRFPLNSSTINYSCASGQPFNSEEIGNLNETTAPGCVRSNALNYTVRVNLLYTGVKIDSSNEDELSDGIRSQFLKAEKEILTICNFFLNDNVTSVQFINEILLQPLGDQTIATLELTIDGSTLNGVNSCGSDYVIEMFKKLNDTAISSNGKLDEFYTIAVGNSTAYGAYTSSPPHRAGRFCPLGFTLLKNIDGVSESVCVPSSPGYYLPAGNTTFEPCPVGTYSDTTGKWECMQCPTGLSTLRIGSQAKTDCIVLCESPLISDTGLPLCNAVPKNTYWTSPTSYRVCPIGGITPGNQGVAREDQCNAPCSNGSFSATGYEPCQLCPIGYYQNESEQTLCVMCPSGLSTLNSGAMSASECIDTAPSVCQNVTCQHGGNCSVEDHHFMCLCEEGYTGEYCETMIDYCESQPCFYNGTCIPTIGNYSCQCPTNTTGINCELEDNDCLSSPCLNGGQCKDQVGSYTCLCQPNGGFSGERCESELDPCASSNCGNGATCWEISSYAYQCHCLGGYTGTMCETNIDDCDPSPCMHGGSCTDQIAGFRCTCPPRYTGELCEETVSTICQETNTRCQDNGRCVDNFLINSPKCICKPGYANGNETICREIDECSSNPCQNNGTCSDEIDDYRCSCIDGFVGKRCQHDVNECESSPCQSGDCVDMVNGFRCDCFNGFNGTLCETDIDDCASNPCSFSGTDQCVDLTDGYNCSCAVGYTGLLCETDIDDCALHPCANGGSCTDEVAGFKCNCTIGWEGDTCTEITSSCQPDPCRNGAQCYDIYRDYYCACKEGYTDKNCDQGQVVCDVINPCDNGGECVVSEGVASCNCSWSFIGKGCQCAKDYCLVNNICENGGTCYLDDSSAFVCSCKPGYAGTQCETRVKAGVCVGVDCGGHGQCEDNLGRATCHCQAGWFGPNCNRIEVDRDFDVLFTGQGELQTAQDILINCSAFSVGFWIKTVKPSSGTIMTVALKQPFNKNFDAVELVTWKQGRVTLKVPTLVGNSYDEYNLSLPIDLSKCDGFWHYAVLSIDLSNKMAQVGIDGKDMIEKVELTGIPVWTLSGSVKMTFGGNNVEDSFRSSVSLLQSWCTAVQFKDQSIADGNAYAIYFDEQRPNVNAWYNEALLSDWSQYAFVIGKGQSSIVGSTQSLKASVCIHNDMSSSLHCSARNFGSVVENQAVSVYFDQNSNLNIRNHNPGDIFKIGIYPVYESSDLLSGQIRSTCTYNVYGRLSNCTDPGPPRNGSLGDCRTDDDLLYSRCNSTCEDGMAPLTTRPQFQTCGPLGVWDTINPYDDYSFPPCGVKKVLRTSVQFGWKYESQYSPGWKASWINHIVAGLRNNNNLKGICVLTSDCNDTVMSLVQDVDLLSNIVFIEVDIPLAPTEVGPVNRMLPVATAIVEAVLQGGLFSSPPNGFDNSLVKSSFWINEKPACEKNAQPVNDYCVECTPGTFFNTTTKVCEFCEQGFYQNQAAQSICMSCGVTNTTVGIGSASQQDCIDICDPGNFYSVSFGQCQECGIGYYQELAGQVFCRLCPPGQSTLSTGSTNSSECNDLCPSGYEMTAGGVCQPCEVGSYRQQLMSASCIQCTPSNYTTKAPASVDISNCSRVVCGEGRYRLGDDPGECVACPIGSYKNGSMSNCTWCGDMMRTDNTGSDSRDDCKYFCPAGSYLSMDNLIDPPKCEGCPKDTYKNESDFYALNCTVCPAASPRTLGVNSTSVDDCKFGLCTAGQAVDPSDTTQCLNCTVGTYQSNPEPTLDHKCTQCPDGSTTYYSSAKSISECKEFCPPGFENDTDSMICKPCPRGYYKDNSDSTLGHMAPFAKCKLCPVENITAGENSTTLQDCNLENCTAGYKIGIDGLCEVCPVGTYQSEKWQATCISCNTGYTTMAEGATSNSSCLKFCPSGQEISSSGDCSNCTIGFYKNNSESVQMKFGACLSCPVEFITEINGATSASDCTIGNCTAGTFLNASKQCEECPIGQYQPERWKTNCHVCSPDYTTLAPGSMSNKTCVKFCESGYEFDTDSDQCQPCAIGYYKDNSAGPRAELASCMMCPLDKITPINGSVSADNCTIANCTAGEKLVGNQCVKCELGSYQDRKWKTECKACPDAESSTSQVGSKSEKQCTEFPNRSWYGFRIKIVNEIWVGEYGKPQSEIYKTLKFRIEVIIGRQLRVKAASVYRDITEVIAFTAGSVIGSLKAWADSSVADPIEVIGKALSEINGIELFDENKTFSPLILEDSQGAIYQYNGTNCTSGTYLIPESGECQPCEDGLFQTPDLIELCIPCDPVGEIPIVKYGEEHEICKSPCDFGWLLPDNTTEPYCQHHGSCQYDSQLEKYYCTCAEGYEGNRCETKIEDHDNLVLYLGLSLGLCIPFILLVFFVVCILRAFKGRRQKPSPENVNKPEEMEVQPIVLQPGQFPPPEYASVLCEDGMPGALKASFFDPDFKAPILPITGSRSVLSVAPGGVVAADGVSNPGYLPMGVQYPTYSSIGPRKFLFYEDQDDSIPEASMDENVSD